MDSKFIYRSLLNKCSDRKDKIYLKHYIRFLNSCSRKNKDMNGISFDKHHILPKSKDLWPEYKCFKKYPWNMIKLTDEQHFIAHKLLYMGLNKEGVQRAFWLMSHTTDGHNLTEIEYETLRLELKKYWSVSMSKTMKNKSTFKDNLGNNYHLDVDDPLIEKHGLVHISTNMHLYQDDLGNKYYLDINDPKIQKFGLISINKGRKLSEEQRNKHKGLVTCKDIFGNNYRVSIFDDRYINGELISVNSGKTNVIKDGKKYKVDVEEYHNNRDSYVHINKNKVTVVDSQGNIFNVDKTDNRLKSGEVEIRVTDKQREASRNNMSQNNESLRGSKWMISPDKTKSKNVKSDLIDSYLRDGWIFGRILNRVKPNIGSKGKCWVSRNGTQKMISLSELSEYKDNGWMRGRNS